MRGITLVTVLTERIDDDSVVKSEDKDGEDVDVRRGYGGCGERYMGGDEFSRQRRWSIERFGREQRIRSVL